MTAVLASDPRPGVRLLTLNRPNRLNTFTIDLVSALNHEFSRIDEDPALRVVVLTGAGRAFSAGLDLDGYGDAYEQRHGFTRGSMTRQHEIAHVVGRIRGLRVPVIAAVNGAAVGAGLALVLASDIRIAAPGAEFSVAFIRAGYSACDLGTSWLLPRLIGAGPAHELMLTGRRFDAAEARDLGLLYRIADGDLLTAAYDKAAEIMRNPPFSVELTKEGMWLGLEQPSLAAAIAFENRQQVIATATADRVEATAAFLERREPRYSGR